jgi:L-aspartate oxidase
VLRDEASLAAASGAIGSLARRMSLGEVEPGRRAWEATNLLTVAAGVVLAASARTESRGCHRRNDHPEPRIDWVRHLEVTLDAGGVVSVADEPRPAT